MFPFNLLSQDQLAAMVRHGANSLVTYLVASGIIPLGVAPEAINLIVAIAAMAFAAYTARENAIIKAANNIDSVTRIVTTNKKLSSDVTLPKTVPSDAQ